MMRRYAVAGVAAVVVVVLFFLFILSPKLNDITGVRGEIEQEEDERQSLQIRLRQLQEAQQLEPTTRARLAVFDRLLPSSPDLPALIRYMQDAASASGIDLRSLAPSQPQELEGATGIQSLSINLVVIGGFFRLQSFLTRIEDLPRVVQVTSLGISSETDEATGLVTLSSTIALVAYVVQPDARLGGPAPAPTPGTPGG